MRSNYKFNFRILLITQQVLLPIMQEPVEAPPTAEQIAVDRQRPGSVWDEKQGNRFQ